MRKKGPCGMSTASQGSLINPKPPSHIKICICYPQLLAARNIQLYFLQLTASPCYKYHWSMHLLCPYCMSRHLHGILLNTRTEQSELVSMILSIKLPLHSTRHHSESFLPPLLKDSPWTAQPLTGFLLVNLDF